MIDINKIDDEFKDYLKVFDLDNEKIYLKYEHTLEVVKIMDKIVSLMGLTEEDKNLALTIAYLHDIGRFEQVEKTDKFSDKEIDHADNGVDLLFNRGLIKKFSIPEEEYRVINVSILNHNKLEIEGGLSEKELFYSKLIRDADKIDIYRVRRVYLNNVFNASPNQINIDDFYKHKSINIQNIKNKGDTILCVLAFVYDLYFKESFLALKETKYLDQFIDIVDVDESLSNEFNKYVKEIKKYMEEKYE